MRSSKKSLNPQRLFKLGTIKPKNDFILNGDDWETGTADHQLCQPLLGSLILSHVIFRERNSVLRKKLFRQLTRPSSRGGIDGDVFVHLFLLAADSAINSILHFLRGN